MKLSVKTDYAARAVLALASWPREGPARKVEDLAETVGTSANYLVQILIEMKGAGLVDSVRGKQGGYRLAKAPEEITLGMVWRASEGSILDVPAIADEACPAGLREAWKTASMALTESADQVSFAQILEASGRDREMYYI
ncbi:MAG: Rrf2 family transcriptional regulator [Verrucomicrobia subdivision 3 bacterium]|nr:Rrf2 family transcriptional regulator [Limisphaerales bacterium]